MPNIQRILFVELLGGIGDVVIALPAIHALARSHPHAHVTVLTFAPGGELLTADPLIHQVIYAAKGQARRAIEQLLAPESLAGTQNLFDLIVSDTNYDGITDVIQTYCTIAYAVFHHPVVAITNLWRSPPPDERVGDRFLTLLENDGLIISEVIDRTKADIHLTSTERISVQQALGALYRPLVVLCIDAGMPIKQWPIEHFIIVGRALQQHYGATVIIPEGADFNQTEQVVQAIGGTAQVWSRGSLRQFAAMLAAADLMIAADTGPARIAAALQVPTITLFGPSWHGRYGQPDPHINLQGGLTCSERVIHNFTEQQCWYSGECPFAWRTCLEDISPDRVLKAAAAVLQRQPQAQEKATQPEDCLSRTGPIATPASVAAWKTVQNVLIMRLDNIGDVLMTSPALRALRQNLPHTKLTLMASPAGALTAPLLPWIDEVLPWRVVWQDLGRLPFDPDREWSLIKTLTDRQFDAAIIFTSFSQSPHPAGFVCALAGIPLRLGESKEQDTQTLTDAVPTAPDSIHQVDRNLRLLEFIDFSIVERRLTLQIPSLSRSFPLPNRYLLLNPWTTCQSRNYNPQRFAIAAQQLSQKTGWPTVVTGMEKDRDRAAPLLSILGNWAIDLIGATTLSDLVALIANAQLVLTNNTSTMHIADATQTPSVVLFAGTEQEQQWRPRHSPSRLLRRPTVCSPCYAFSCPYDLQCLDITPETVVAAGLDLLQEAAMEVMGRGHGVEMKNPLIHPSVPPCVKF
jgi:ADP-heptose:LPS heptosyltransferase